MLSTGQKAIVNNPYQQYLQRQEDQMVLNAEELSSGRHQRPRMVKTKGGVSHKQISVAAILGHDKQHLPVYVDKIRSTD